MTQLTIRPLQGWTGPWTPSSQRQRSVFTRQKVKKNAAGEAYRSLDREPMPWSDTLLILDRELEALGASAVVLQISVTERDLRLDGQLRADARPANPAVRLLFDSRHGPLTYQCDQFATWQDNGRAIALGLEALRKVERYGITTAGQQYKGWLQLQAGAGPGAPTTRDQAAQLLSEISGVHVDPDESHQSLRARWRESRSAAHPDRNGGRQDLWDRVEAAARLLGLDSR